MNKVMKKIKRNNNKEMLKTFLLSNGLAPKIVVLLALDGIHLKTINNKSMNMNIQIELNKK